MTDIDNESTDTVETNDVTETLTENTRVPNYVLITAAAAAVVGVTVGTLRVIGKVRARRQSKTESNDSETETVIVTPDDVK